MYLWPEHVDAGSFKTQTVPGVRLSWRIRVKCVQMTSRPPIREGETCTLRANSQTLPCMRATQGINEVRRAGTKQA